MTFTDVTVTVSLARLPAVDTDSPAVFGTLFGVSAVPGAATATASWAGLTQCVLCVANDLVLGADSYFFPRPGIITVTGGHVEVAGGLSGSSGSSVTVTNGEIRLAEPPSPGVTLVPDPTTLPPGAMPHPAVAAVVREWIEAAGTLAPGDPARCGPTQGSPHGMVVYADVSGCTSFEPGIYVVTGRKTSQGSDATIRIPVSATNVLFYLTCGNDSGQPMPCASAPTHAKLAPNGRHVAQPTITGLSGVDPDVNGYAIVVDPVNPNTQSIGRMTVEGDIYAPNVPSAQSPGPSVTVTRLTVHGSLIADSFRGSSGQALTLADTTPAADGPVRLVP